MKYVFLSYVQRYRQTLRAIRENVITNFLSNQRFMKGLSCDKGTTVVAFVSINAEEDASYSGAAWTQLSVAVLLLSIPGII